MLGAMDAAAALGVRIRITAFTPLTENMPGGSAIKPGDVLTTRKGKTIEVLNTDAEGRLVLSDGLTLAAESGPDAIIDLATLTGAVVVALGKEIAGLLGNRDELIDQVHAAGDRAGEPNWPLPLPDDYRNHIDSEVADMRNMGRPGQAGSISAAMLLREFVDSVPWAHLDIAGAARSDENSRYLAKGATGFGVRTLVALITSEEFARGWWIWVGPDRPVGSSRHPGDREGSGPGTETGTGNWSDGAVGSGVRIAVLGAGSWGTTVASLVAPRHDTVLWARNADVAKAINADHANAAYLPGFDLPPELSATSSLDGGRRARPIS